MKSLVIASLCVAMVALVGCNSKSSDLGDVTGTVTYNGEPITEGTLAFVPSTGGKPGTGVINDDGSITMTTYEEGDGLSKGTGRIMYNAPELPTPTDLKPGQDIPKHELYGLVPKEKEITITDGTNTLTIELVKP